jgi:hypothetical protein
MVRVGFLREVRAGLATAACASASGHRPHRELKTAMNPKTHFRPWSVQDPTDRFFSVHCLAVVVALARLTDQALF